MKRANLLRDLALAGAATVISCAIAISCHLTQRPDDWQAVNNNALSHEQAGQTDLISLPSDSASPAGNTGARETRKPRPGKPLRHQ